MLVRFALAALSMSLVSGCLGQSGHEDIAPSGTTNDSYTLSPSPSGGPGIAPTIPLKWLAGPCEGLGTLFDWPNGTEPFGWNTPPGWEPRAFLVFGSWIEIYQCERLHWGNFERGPIFVGMEYHSYGDPPSSCLEGEGDFVGFLHAFWFSDAEVAAFVNSTYGFMTHVASFNWTLEQTPGRMTGAMEWRAEGEETSLLRGYVVDAGPSSMKTTTRLYWFNATAVSYMDVTHETELPQVPTLFAEGELAPPTLYAESGMRTYAGRASVYFATEFSSEIHRFRDFECLELA